MELLNQAIATDAGMMAIWVSSAFTTIQDPDAWENAFLDDTSVEAFIRNGNLAPININADGAFQVVVRAGGEDGPEDLSDRERTYVFVTSQPYRLSVDSTVCISGIEDISSTIYPNVYHFELPAGEYAVTIHMIDWESEPGMKLSDGNPAPDALPDFVAIINPARQGTTFRTKAVTFER